MSYTGPPPTEPPAGDWRPPVVFHPPAPRRLPPQDHRSLDAQERDARRVTWAVAAGAGLVALLLICALIGQLLA